MINACFPCSVLIQHLKNRGKRYPTSSQISMFLKWTNTLKKNKKSWLFSFLLILHSQGWVGRKFGILVVGRGKNYSTTAFFQEEISIPQADSWVDIQAELKVTGGQHCKQRVKKVFQWQVLSQKYLVGRTREMSLETARHGYFSVKLVKTS